MANSMLLINAGVVLQCPREDCNYKWIYRGNRIFYAGCPSCHRNVRIDKNQVVGQLGRHPTTGIREDGRTGLASGSDVNINGK